MKVSTLPGRMSRHARFRLSGTQRRAREWLADFDAVPRNDEFNSTFRWLRRRHRSNRQPWRPQYGWGVMNAAKSAQGLGIERISVLELGVAGGNGLVALEAAAQNAQLLFDVQIDVFGLDSGVGMPAPTDRRDGGFALVGGEFPMNVDRLRNRLSRAQLILGPVEETARAFAREQHPPLGFIAFDLDYYSSTIGALVLLEAGHEHLLPRLYCYFDDVIWYPWTEFTGERAAITDFNDMHEQRKIGTLLGLKAHLPRTEWELAWPDQTYVAEIFDHPLYDTSEGMTAPDLRLNT